MNADHPLAVWVARMGVNIVVLHGELNVPQAVLTCGVMHMQRFVYNEWLSYEGYRQGSDVYTSVKNVAAWLDSALHDCSEQDAEVHLIGIATERCLWILQQDDATVWFVGNAGIYICANRDSTMFFEDEELVLSGIWLRFAIPIVNSDNAAIRGWFYQNYHTGPDGELPSIASLVLAFDETDSAKLEVNF